MNINMQLKKLFIPLTVCALAYTPGALAVELGPRIGSPIQKHMMNDAIQLRITPRGQRIFDSSLSEILNNLGVNLKEGYFPSQSFSAQKAIDIDYYKDTSPEAVKMFKQVRELMTHWFVGFSLNDPRPAVQIGDSSFMAQFAHMGVVADQELMNKIGKREGAVLAIELEITSLKLATQSVKAWDLNNEFAGQIGLNDVSVELGSPSNPLKIRMPFYFRLNAQGLLEFEVLDVSQNIDQMDISVQYKKLLLPEVSVNINGKKFVLNTDEVDKLITDKMPDIFKDLRGSLSYFAKKQLPAMLNEKAKQYVTGALEQVQEMSAPGAEKNDTRPNFKWGLVLSDIKLQNSLNINLDAYVEDSTNPQQKLNVQNQARSLPTFNELSPEQYDIAMSVDRAMINRILELSFYRKNFEKLSLGDGKTLRLTAAPTVDYVTPPHDPSVPAQDGFIKVHVSVETDVESIFLKNKIVVAFDLISRLRQMPNHKGTQLVLYSIDTNSIEMDPKYLTFFGSIFAGNVKSALQKQLGSFNQIWKQKETTIPGSLPLPPQVLGIKMDLTKVLVTPSGQLMMYLNYAPKNNSISIPAIVGVEK